MQTVHACMHTQPAAFTQPIMRRACCNRTSIQLLADGHKTRVTMATVLRLVEHNIKLFLTLPNTIDIRYL